VVLVTGEQQGIGAAIAREFAPAGADVAINWLGDEGAAQRITICTGGRRAVLVRADVRQLEQVRAMVSKSQDDLGPVVWN
jgi:NAD(P)-dependent dehydrogenase (short-subunit alcohol dehydrogenase family)